MSTGAFCWNETSKQLTANATGFVQRTDSPHAYSREGACTPVSVARVTAGRAARPRRNLHLHASARG